MKQFFKKIFARLGFKSTRPAVKRNGKTIGSAVSVTVDGNVVGLKAFADAHGALVVAVQQTTGMTRQAVKAFRRSRQAQMYMETGLDHGSAHTLAKRYRMSLRDLVDYYHYFGQLPKEEYRTIIISYGVQALISEFEGMIEKSGV